MFKSTIFFAVVLIAFSSCSKESIIEPIVGEYHAALLCSETGEEEGYVDAVVRELSGDRIAIDFDSEVGSMTADVSEDYEITMTSYGRTDLPMTTMKGTGEFRIETIQNSTRTAKLIVIHFEDEDPTKYCMLQLVEKI